MSEFCKQCSEIIFGQDFEEFKGLVSEKDDEDGMVAIVCCEGCGVTEVNSKGECVRANCNHCKEEL